MAKRGEKSWLAKAAGAADRLGDAAKKKVVKTVKAVEQKAVSTARAAERRLVSAERYVKHTAAPVVKKVVDTGRSLEKKAVKGAKAVEKKAVSTAKTAEKRLVSAERYVKQTVTPVVKKVVDTGKSLEEKAVKGAKAVEKKVEKAVVPAVKKGAEATVHTAKDIVGVVKAAPEAIAREAEGYRQVVNNVVQDYREARRHKADTPQDESFSQGHNGLEYVRNNPDDEVKVQRILEGGDRNAIKQRFEQEWNAKAERYKAIPGYAGAMFRGVKRGQYDRASNISLFDEDISSFSRYQLERDLLGEEQGSFFQKELSSLTEWFGKNGPGIAKTAVASPFSPLVGAGVSAQDAGMMAWSDTLIAEMEKAHVDTTDRTAVREYLKKHPETRERADHAMAWAAAAGGVAGVIPVAKAGGPAATTLKLAKLGKYEKPIVEGFNTVVQGVIPAAGEAGRQLQEDKRLTDPKAVWSAGISGALQDTLGKPIKSGTEKSIKIGKEIVSGKSRVESGGVAGGSEKPAEITPKTDKTSPSPQQEKNGQAVSKEEKPQKKVEAGKSGDDNGNSREKTETLALPKSAPQKALPKPDGIGEGPALMKTDNEQASSKVLRSLLNLDGKPGLLEMPYVTGKNKLSMLDFLPPANATEGHMPPFRALPAPTGPAPIALPVPAIKHGGTKSSDSRILLKDLSARRPFDTVRMV